MKNLANKIKKYYLVPYQTRQELIDHILKTFNEGDKITGFSIVAKKENSCYKTMFGAQRMLPKKESDVKFQHLSDVPENEKDFALRGKWVKVCDLA